MAETLLQFQTAVTAPDDRAYTARACGGPMSGGTWEGWLEFDPLDGGAPVRSQRETTQPNRADTEYWASGLTPVYLEGSLRRALTGPIRVPTIQVRRPAFDGPAPPTTAAPASDGAVPHGVLDPFSVYRNGEDQLRRQLRALSSWHLVNIVREHELSGMPADALKAASQATLIELIVSGVREEIRQD